MRVLVLLFLLVPLAGLTSGDDKPPAKKKDPIAELAGVWKNDAMVVNERRFEEVVLTIHTDGKGKSTYKEKEGAELKQRTVEVRVFLAKVEGSKEVVLLIRDYLGVQWRVRRHSPTELIGAAFYSTKEGPIAVEHAFKKVSAEP